MSEMCSSQNGPYTCELKAGHDGPHRVKYANQEDKTWQNAHTNLTWRDVERVIEDLKRDGYKPTELSSNTSEPRPKKAFLLRVNRSTDKGTKRSSHTDNSP